MGEPRTGPPRLPSAGEDLARAEREPDTPQTRSPSYRLAFPDREFLLRPSSGRCAFSWSC